ncbi:MAG: S-methyl-5'-thioadenosine phosphorylase [Phenylobacterium sp.]|uniref:S-methyl-5'-thioadenosine phosphorylase n=1 Tax=Phenylobacterium sp. TaxID=1871053 RepID=UPI0027376784|nr:S-methyl-5'-thioadenosine phosphorylase [Phenylobacterium sp.]MDP3118384.1 S-methyl-5'-thioadenosine phosphorylase [Phenylobacterium sp.]
MKQWTIGVIGGSGLYDLDGLRNRQTLSINSPWGAPSDELVTGELDDVRLVFLPRHGRGHRIPPGALNARANIDVLKRAGCTDILSVSAVGSLREELPPGTFVLVDQYIDRTVSRPASFFGEGLVAHVSMAEPVCPRLSAAAAAAARSAGAPTVEGGTYLAMEGPQFSTKAESHLYRSWGCSVIGMTAMPEARLAREAELPYANVCMVTDYDCWREATAHVEVSNVLEVLQSNADTARQMIAALARSLPEMREPSPIDTGLDYAVITDPGLWDPALAAKLAGICSRKFSAAAAG